ncbi:uncharacterized protein E0L32_008649 [Thyridium curvatum]|uniref:Uncharacterized protein n=1 Tax=Thyridium curvatum TaxID=1093900 RepID=A0A507B1K0_9PEZI|nr:uncharacterized protein E0L32_008649 [Thyridium curvatum]TPX10430.1 hypothetical protein E0L32_008649 [Thyridium curvatum]
MTNGLHMAKSGDEPECMGIATVPVPRQAFLKSETGSPDYLSLTTEEGMERYQEYLGRRQEARDRYIASRAALKRDLNQARDDYYDELKEVCRYRAEVREGASRLPPPLASIWHRLIGQTFEFLRRDLHTKPGHDELHRHTVAAKEGRSRIDTEYKEEEERLRKEYQHILHPIALAD